MSEESEKQLVFYRTRDFNIGIEEVFPIKETKKTITILINQGSRSRQIRCNKDGGYERYWPTRIDAINHLLERSSEKLRKGSLMVTDALKNIKTLNVERNKEQS